MSVASEERGVWLSSGRFDCAPPLAGCMWPHLGFVRNTAPIDRLVVTRKAMAGKLSALTRAAAAVLTLERREKIIISFYVT